MNSHLIERLAQQRGIGAAFHDYRGDWRVISSRTKAALLRAMGVELDEHNGEAETYKARLLERVFIIHVDTPARIALNLHSLPRVGLVQWVLQLETGGKLSGQIDAALLHQVGSEQGQLLLPDHLPAGYHELHVRIAHEEHHATVVIAPMRCYSPVRLEQERVWGIAVQLYTLRSERNWGIGDFADLQELIAQAAPLGCTIIGVNPLHALMPANPDHISPYSPSSRQFLNVLYIAVPAVDEFAHATEAQQTIAAPAFQRKLAQLRECANVDYAQVATLKLKILRMLHLSFTALPPSSERRAAFEAYVQSRGESLQLHALHDALDAHLRKQSNRYWGWPSWPDELRDPRSPAVHAFSRTHAADVQFHLYLQWLAEEQLAATHAFARNQGMSIGLYGDVAVGVNPAGSETWANQRLYRHDASIGAPPDPLALKGQDWGIPPQDPTELREQHYLPYVEMLRSNMRHVAALRLDHVMALFRLWWVPKGFLSRDGAYVHYPLEELMSILALESERNRCIVIGEDLGTVPDEVRAAMQRYEVYHYRVLLFEKDQQGAFKPPSAYTAGSLATVTTHDLPTLKGWWESADLLLRDELDSFPSQESRAEARQQRAADREQLMRALVAQGLWRRQPDDPLPDYSPALIRAIHAYLGLSHANIALVQLEDLIAMSDAVNVPGTSTEHANWQRKMAQNTTEIFQRAEVLDILEALQVARRGKNPNEQYES